MDLNQASVLVEASIKELKVDPVACRGKNPGQWALTYKGVSVWIDVFSSAANSNRWYFSVMSPLLEVPAKNKESFYESCLEINHNLYGSAICKKNDWTYVTLLRETEGLDQSEVNATLDRVAIYCSDYRGKLQFKFEGSWTPKAAPGGAAPTEGPVNP